MCNCSGMVRTGEETQGGKYPPSDHAPGCEDFHTERFIRVEHDGTFCVMEPADAEEYLHDSDEEYAVSDVWLTRDQFEKLPEFEGF